MREIKFKVNIDGDWTVLTLNEMLEYQSEGNDLTSCQKRQCAGFKDINKIELAEGDIVKYSHFEDEEYDIENDKISKDAQLAVCKWGGEIYPAFELYNNQGFSGDYDFPIDEEFNSFSSEMYRFEIIGNIIDNPELLEEKEEK